jgi:flagellar biosynthetic protein FliO
MSASQSAHTAQAAPGTIPFKREEPGIAGALTGGAVGLLVVSLVVIALALWARKRLNLAPGQSRADSRLRIVETRRLGPRALLSVVEFGDRAYLLAQTEQGISRIADIDAGGGR